MEEVYNQISEKTKSLLELIVSCKNDSGQTLKLSYKLLSIIALMKVLSKRLEGPIVEEIDVLEKKIRIFLQDSKNVEVISDIHEISQRIIEEASSY